MGRWSSGPGRACGQGHLSRSSLEMEPKGLRLQQEESWSDTRKNFQTFKGSNFEMRT